MARVLLLVLFCVLCGYVADTISSQPNIQLSLTQKGLEYVNNALVNNLVKQVRDLAIPPQQLKPLRSTLLRFYNTKVRTVNLKSASLRIMNNGLVGVSLKLSHVKVAGDFFYKLSGWFPYKHEDRFTTEMNNVVIVQDLSIEHDNMGRPVIKDKGCDTQIGRSRYGFGSSFFLNAVAKLAKKYVQKTIAKQVCKSVTKGLQEKGKLLPSLWPDGFRLSNNHCAKITYPITRRPIVETNYLDFLITGKAKSSCSSSFVSSNSTMAGHTRHVPSPSKMLSFSFSDQFMNALARLYYQLGRMTWTFPVVMQQGNSSTNVQVKIQAAGSPVIHTIINGSSIRFAAKTTINGPASLGKMLLLQENVVVTSEMIFQVERKRLSAKFSNLRVAQQPLGSSASQSKSQTFQLIQTHTAKFAETINKSLRYMIPLPVFDKLQLENEQIVYKKGHVILETDAKF